MCIVPKAPKAPAPLAARQAPRAPDAAVTTDQTRADLMRRSTMASMILTGPNGALGSASTVGKSVLGA